MAARAKRLTTNVAGDFFVDSTCIDCAACRWVAPDSFAAAGDYSAVTQQPASTAQILRAQMALLACPTGSIGTESKHDLSEARAAYPDPITGTVSYLGYHHEDSFGAAAWLIQHPEGNALVDSPRFTREVVAALHARGGVRWLLLTHRDDVADHAKFHAEFDCERVIHARDARGGLRQVERLIEGDDATSLADGLLAIPTPGHTQGSMCFWWDQTLFSGDHLAWSQQRQRLVAFHRACWYDWPTQIRSMERLRAYAFAHVLPGHGAPAHLPPSAMSQQLEQCIAWMRSV